MELIVHRSIRQYTPQQSGPTSRVTHSFGSNKLYICLSNKCFNCIQHICCVMDVRPSQDHRILRMQRVWINLALLFGFLSQNFRMLQGPVNVTLSFYKCNLSGGDTQTLPYAKEFVWTFCTQSQWGHKNFECERLRPRATIVKYLIYLDLIHATNMDNAAILTNFMFASIQCLLFPFEVCLFGNII